MNVEDILQDFATTENKLPRASMQWALDNWAEAGPRFVELLERYAAGIDRSGEDADALFFVIHLLGGKGEKAAFPALCRLMRDAEAAERVLGDAITESLKGIVINTYDGDQDALKAVIEDAKTDEFLRHAALMAMTYHARTGGVTEGEMRAYLLHLLAEMQPQASCYVWEGWVSSVALLGYQDLAEKAEQLIAQEFVPPRVTTVDYFRGDLRRTLENPDGMEGFDYDSVKPLTDPIGTLARWYCFSERYAADKAERQARRQQPEDFIESYLAQPYVNPARRIGRNDPCPCGSGKKYKQCCLQ